MPWPHLYKTDDKSITALQCATLIQTIVVKEMMMHFPSSLFMQFEQIQKETPSSPTNSCNECFWHCSQKIQWNKLLNEEQANGRLRSIKLKKHTKMQLCMSASSKFWYRFSPIYNTALVPANQVTSRTKGGKNQIISLKVKFEIYILFYKPTTQTSIPWSIVVQFPNDTNLSHASEKKKKTKNTKGKGFSPENLLRPEWKEGNRRKKVIMKDHK